MGCANASRGDGRGDVNGDAVEDRGPRERTGRARWKLEMPAGLVPVIEGDDMGVAERATCHGAGDDRRMMVCRVGGDALGLDWLR